MHVPDPVHGRKQIDDQVIEAHLAKILLVRAVRARNAKLHRQLIKSLRDVPRLIQFVVVTISFVRFGRGLWRLQLREYAYGDAIRLLIFLFLILI